MSARILQAELVLHGQPFPPLGTAGQCVKGHVQPGRTQRCLGTASALSLPAKAIV